VNVTPNSQSGEAEHPSPSSAPARYWIAIPFYLRLLVLGEIGLVAVVVGVAVTTQGSSNSTVRLVTDFELALLALTLLVLTLLTEYSTRKSSQDVHTLIGAVRSENRVLISENKAHWNEQRAHLDSLVGTLRQLVQLQADLISAVKRLDESQRASIEAQKEDIKVREDALRKEIEKHKPALDIRVSRFDGKLIKHFMIFVSNHGPPGVDLDITFSVGGVGTSEHADLISQGAPCERDFGDISHFPDAGALQIICEVSNGTRSHRYRFMAEYRYARNRGFWGSSPEITRLSPEVLEAEVLF
jgi:hypothetical protein